MMLVFLISCVAACILIVLRSATLSLQESNRMLDKYEELLAEARETKLRRTHQMEEAEELSRH